MVAIHCLYVVALGLVFSRFKLVRWDRLSEAIPAGYRVHLRNFSRDFQVFQTSGRVTMTGAWWKRHRM
jgi:hypothetical protein